VTWHRLPTHSNWEATDTQPAVHWQKRCSRTWEVGTLSVDDVGVDGTGQESMRNKSTGLTKRLSLFLPCVRLCILPPASSCQTDRSWIAKWNWWLYSITRASPGLSLAILFRGGLCNTEERSANRCTRKLTQNFLPLIDIQGCYLTPVSEKRQSPPAPPHGSPDHCTVTVMLQPRPADSVQMLRCWRGCEK
jgi:hypothetical protein